MSMIDFQERLMLLPEELDVFCGRGRGGGKSYGLALIFLRHVEQCRGKERMWLRDLQCLQSDSVMESEAFSR